MLQELEMLPNIYEKLLFLFRECLITIPKHIYLKILNECENVIKNVIKITIF